MFTVEGFLDGIYCTAVVGGPLPELGVVSGSDNILPYLAVQQGRHDPDDAKLSGWNSLLRMDGSGCPSDRSVWFTEP